MTTTSRKSLWPRRWLRSFAGAALATAVVGGAVWAADPAADGQPSAKEPAKEALKAADAKDAPKTSGPVIDTPAPAPKQKLVAFSMSDKPWADVMAWYANESGLAFNSVEKPPTGTFNFIPPKDAKTGQPRQYTLSQITDVLNEALLAKNFVLIRATQTFRLWPATDKTHPAPDRPLAV